MSDKPPFGSSDDRWWDWVYPIFLILLPIAGPAVFMLCVHEGWWA